MKFQMKRSVRIFNALSIGAAIGCSSLIFLPQITPRARAYSAGYNGKIAFGTFRDGNAEVYTMNADGSGPENFSTSTGGDWVDSWSPDGSRVLFRSVRDGNIEIYSVNAGGSSLARLTNATGTDANTHWSPDGTKVAFNSMRDGNIEIYVMDADGSNQIRLTNNSSVDSVPQWSPNSAKIIFYSNRDGGNYEIYVMDADGSNQIRLTNSVGTDAYPQWSPDGSKILFYSTRDGNQEIYVMNADGSSPIRKTHTLVDESVYSTAKWSPDGLVIAVSREDEEWEASTLVLLEAMGAGEQVFNFASSSLIIIDDLNWSADGQKLLITGYHESNKNTWDQYVVNKNGSNLIQLTNDGESGYGVWQPIPNVAPAAIADSLSVAYLTTGVASVLTNDTDEEALSGSNLSVSIQAAHGSASVNSSLGKIEYTPDDGYYGPDSLTYQICDSFELDQKCSTAVLGISVGSPGAPSLTVGKVDGKDATPGGTVSSSTAKPVFQGTASVGAEITVTINSDPIILNTTADDDGSWSVTPTDPIPPGQHTVTISAALNGQTTTLDSFVLGIQAELPQAGAELLYSQVLGSALAVMGYGLFVLDKRRKLQRHIRPVLNSVN